jgi:hypothetical protein
MRRIPNVAGAADIGGPGLRRFHHCVVNADRQKHHAVLVADGSLYWIGTNRDRAPQLLDRSFESAYPMGRKTTEEILGTWWHSMRIGLILQFAGSYAFSRFPVTSRS